MGYILLFEADSVQGLQAVVPVLGELEPGRKGRFEARGFGLGLLADIGGAELLWKSKMAEAGLQVLDVHGEGADLAVVDWVVTGLAQGQSAGQVTPAFPFIPVLLVIVAIIGVLLALGWVINNFKALVEELPEAVKDLWPVALVIGGVVLVIMALGGRSKSEVRQGQREAVPA